MTLQQHLQDLSFNKDYPAIVRHAKGLLLALQESKIYQNLLVMDMQEQEQEPQPNEEDQRAYKTAEGCYKGIVEQFKMMDMALEAQHDKQYDSLADEMDDFSYGVAIERLFHIELAGGGPACRISGKLDEDNQPYNVALEYQDWGTPWTEYRKVSHETLERFAERFVPYFEKQ